MAATRSRDRVNLSVTPHLAAILERHARPGEPRAATAARLIEQADALPVSEDELRAQQAAGLDALAGLVSYPDDYLDELRGDWEGRP